jgi:hypothetical protein
MASQLFFSAYVRCNKKWQFDGHFSVHINHQLFVVTSSFVGNCTSLRKTNRSAKHRRHAHHQPKAHASCVPDGAVEWKRSTLQYKNKECVECQTQANAGGG